MIRLYYVPGGANMVVHAVLEHIGTPYELKPVNSDSGETQSEEFLELSPDGRVPALVDGRVIMHESSAIAMYLADRFSDAGLVPDIDPDRSRYYLWMVLLGNTVEEALLRWYHPDDYVVGAPEQAAVKLAAEVRLTELWGRVDDALDDRSYLTGNTMTTADLMLFMLCFWSRRMKMPPSRWDNISTWLQDMQDQECIRAMMSQEGLAWGFAS